MRTQTRSWRQHALRVCGVAALWSASQVALAQNNTPDEHYNRGVELARAGDYAEARAEFEAAFRLSPHPAVLYSLAKVALSQGDQAAAIVYLERYLELGATSMPAEQVQEVHKALAELRVAAANGSAPHAEATPPPASTAPTSQAPGSQAPGSQAPGSQSPGSQAQTPVPDAPSAAPGAAQAGSGPRPAPARSRAVAEPRAPAPPPVAVHPNAARTWPAWTLSVAGAAFTLGGLGLYWYNDRTYDALLSERESLQADAPPAPRNSDEVGEGLAWSRAVGRNDEAFEAVQTLDVVAWTTAGVGLACLGAGLWWLLDSGDANPPPLTATGRGLMLHW